MCSFNNVTIIPQPLRPATATTHPVVLAKMFCVLPLLVSGHCVWNWLSGYKRLLRKKCKNKDVHHKNRWGTFSKFHEGYTYTFLLIRETPSQMWCRYGSWVTHGERLPPCNKSLLKQAGTGLLPEPSSHYTTSWASLGDLQIHSWMQCVTEMGRNELFLPLPLICQADRWQTCCYLSLCWTAVATDYHIFLMAVRRLDNAHTHIHTVSPIHMVCIMDLSCNS